METLTFSLFSLRPLFYPALRSFVVWRLYDVRDLILSNRMFRCVSFSTLLYFSLVQFCHPVHYETHIFTLSLFFGVSTSFFITVYN